MIYSLSLQFILANFLYLYCSNSAASTTGSLLKPFLSSSLTVSAEKSKMKNEEIVLDGQTQTLSTPAWSTTGNPHILVAGGAGYIGTHTIVCLLNSGYDVTVVDNLVNSNKESLNRVLDITGVNESSNRLRFYQLDMCNRNDLEMMFKTSPEFEACIHFAGLKAVGESVRLPLKYYSNNLDSTIHLLDLMDQYKCRTIVFSSSATVYGSAKVPITEDTPAGLDITNAYGRTKFMIEEILKDFKKSKDIESATTTDGNHDNKTNDWSIITLRYFNPVGNHPSGKIGEDPNGIPNNLMPYVSQVAIGRREKLTIFGNDYNTPDGTGVRDYIHVMDLAEGHVAALQYIKKNKVLGKGYNQYSVFNLGTGTGYSVLEMVAAMRKASGAPVLYDIGPRREGDIAVCYADPSRAYDLLGWKASRTLEDMCKDLWAWCVNNPKGYASTSSTNTNA